MPVHHDFKIIFVHIPKTGGTSIDMHVTQMSNKQKAGEAWDLWGTPTADHEQKLGPKRVIDPSSGHRAKQLHHLPAKNIKELVSQDVWNSYLKFAVVRNPWDRIVSYYEYGRQTGGRIGTEGKSFKEWLYERTVIPSCAPYIQLDSGEIGVDQIIRFENLVNGFQEICNIAGLPFSTDDFPHYKKTERLSHYSEYYDQDMQNLVAVNAAQDIEMFGYEFGK